MRRRFAGIAFAVFFGAARAQDSASSQEHVHHHETTPSAEIATDHVPPDPPTHVMADMSYQEMIEQMQMDDAAPFGQVMLKRLEWRDARDGSAAAWEARAWYGNDYNKALFKTDGERVDAATEEASAELLWDRIVARWWSLQVGARSDFGIGPTRSWAAIGMEGLAPYWFDVEATLYLGNNGRTALSFKADYEWLFTQKLILQPELEGVLYGKEDRERSIGSGLSDIEAGLRLRYEFRREFAAYAGIVWQRKFAGTAAFARGSAEPVSDTQFVMGLRAWF